MRVNVTPKIVARAKDFCERVSRKPGASRADFDRSTRNISHMIALLALGDALKLDVNEEVWKGEGEPVNFHTAHTRKKGKLHTVQVQSRMGYDFKIAVDPDEIKADVFVLGLVSPDQTYVEYPGAVSAAGLRSQGQIERGWTHRGALEPLTLSRGLLSEPLLLALEER